MPEDWDGQGPQNLIANWTSLTELKEKNQRSLSGLEHGRCGKIRKEVMRTAVLPGFVLELSRGRPEARKEESKAGVRRTARAGDPS